MAAYVYCKKKPTAVGEKVVYVGASWGKPRFWGVVRRFREDGFLEIEVRGVAREYIYHYSKGLRFREEPWKGYRWLRRVF